MRQRTFLASLLCLALAVKPDRETCGADCKGQIVAHYLGQWRAIRDYIAAHPDTLSGPDLVSGARRIVEGVAAMKPDSVGGPVKVLEITAAGARWRD